MRGFTQDLRYALRGLLKAPGFTTVVVLTLALGIGATTAMFSVVNGILLRPLPFPEQDRLIELVHEAPGVGISRILASPAVYFGYRDHSRTFEAVGLWDWDSSPVTVTGSGDPESVRSVEVTHEVLAILGVTPMMGRGFDQTDDLPGSAPTAIISHVYWMRHFSGRNPLERALVVDGVSRQVIGVLPESFRFFDYAADIFYPLQPVRAEAGFPSGDGRGIARLKPNVTLSEANADVARMIPILNEEFGRPGVLERTRFGPKLSWLKDTVVGDLRDTLWILMGTIGLLLLTACANVANLVIVRTQARRPELAVRTALGAAWTAIARFVFAENAILGLAGGAAGGAVAHFSLPFLLLLGADYLPSIMTVKIDLTVLLAALAISVLATIVIAFIPIFRFARPQPQLRDALHRSGRAITEGQEGNRLRHMLLVAQVSLTLILLIGSGLMIRTFVTLRQVDPGFRDPATVQTFQLTIPTADAPDAERAERTLRMQHAIVEAIAAVPGVRSAAFSSSNDGLPLDGDGRTSVIFVEGKVTDDRLPPPKEIQAVSPHFFETLQTPVIAGRTFDWSDVHQRRRVVLVSENLARAEWGAAGAALGKRISVNRTGPWSDVIGVVKDVHHNGLGQPAPETVIFPAFTRNAVASFVIRSDRVGTIGFLNDLRRAVWSVNGNLSLASIQTMGDLYQRSMARTSLTLQLLAITAGIALMLGLIGVYGVVSYAISQRRREIGIRVALGAAHGKVRRMFVRQALVLVGMGVAIGLVAALGLTRLMESELFGVGPLDPLSYVSVSLMLILTAMIASDLPARRAARVDPLVALRYE